MPGPQPQARGDVWTPTGRSWHTNNGPIQVRNGAGLVGVQRPGHGNPSNPHTAATEKIVADLAHLVGLPVPPITLWDRGEAASLPRYVAVSAWAFADAATWAEGSPALTPQDQASLLPWASAMIPFEEWIAAQDRQNAGNVLITKRANGDVAGAWIDYAFALDHSWRGNQMPYALFRECTRPWELLTQWL